LVVFRRDFRFPLVVTLSLILSSACVSENYGTAQDQPDTVKIADTLGEFCAKLPRPAYAELTKHTVSNGWFEVYEIDAGIWAIYEPHQWQEVISYLIVGTQSALLFDTGNGLGNIKEIIDQLTDKPVTVINSHSKSRLSRLIFRSAVVVVLMMNRLKKKHLRRHYVARYLPA